MAAKGASSPMTALERVLGGIFFAFYLLVLPFAADPMFTALSRLIGRDIPDHLRNIIFYYTLFALTVVIFWHYLGHATSYFFSNLWKTLGAVSVGMVAFYGVNELAYRVFALILPNMTNLNDIAISAQIQDAPRSTALIIIFLAPFVEEVLFRGYIFGNLRATNRVAAYAVSCILFAFLHVWQFVTIYRDLSYFLLMLQYLVPGLVLAWTYERSGTLWGSVLLHAFVNALAVWSVL